MEFKIIKKLNYAGEMNIRQYEITIEFYTKKQMKTIYPNKNYRTVGEIGNKTGVQCDTVENLDGKPLPVYKEKTHNNFMEAVVGYAAVDDNIFLEVVKNVLIQRIITFLIIIVLLSGGITAAVNYQTWFG